MSNGGSGPRVAVSGGGGDLDLVALIDEVVLEVTPVVSLELAPQDFLLCLHGHRMVGLSLSPRKKLDL
jgi:hypothetical protein